MAQVLKLKRTAVSGKIPTTSHLELGELAMNTFDGRIFLKKDSGTPIITEILTTNTEGSITGSLNLNGDITATNLTLSGNATIDGNLTLGGNITIGDNVADIVTVTAGFSGSLIPDATSLYDLGSTTKKWNNLNVVTASADYFIGDGSGLTNVVTTVSEQTSVSESFTNQDDITITHGFDSRNIHVSVYDVSNQLIIPETIELTTTNTVNVTLSTPSNGYIVVSKGGHILSGSQPISQETTVTASFDAQSTINVNHGFDSKNVLVSVYDVNDSQIIPETVSLTDNNNIQVVLSTAESGFVVVAKGGHIVQGTNSNATQLDSQNASYYLDYNNFTNVPSGLVSGSDQLTGSYDTRYALSGSAGGGTSDFTQLTNVPSGLVSSSAQTISNLGGSNIVSGSVVTTLNGTSVFSGSSQVEFNDVNNTPFSQSATEVTTTKSIVPSTTTLDLGTPTNPFRDLYLSSASLYIDGQQVISSDTNTLTFTTDVGQSIKILETGADDIILQTDTGNIELKGTVEILSGKKIVDSAGTKILFGDSLGITGSIDLTGTVDGVDISQFKTDFDTLEGKTLISSSQQITDGSGIISGSVLRTLDGTSVISGSVLRPNGDSIVSSSIQIDLTQTTNYESGIKDKLDTEQVLSGSVISGNKTFNNDLTIAGNLSVQGTTTTIDTTTFNVADNIIELNYGGSATTAGIYTKDPTAPNTISGSLLWDSTNDYWIAGQSGSESKVLVKNGDGVVSGSSQVDYNSIQNKPTIPTNNNQLTNGAEYITSTLFSDSADSNFTIETTSNGSDARINLRASSTGTSQIRFGDEDSVNVGLITYFHTDNSLAFRNNGSTNMLIDSSGRVGIGTSSPAELVDISKNDIVSGGSRIRLTNSHNGSDWGIDTVLGGIDFYSSDNSNTGTVAGIDIIQDVINATQPRDCAIVFKTRTGATSSDAEERVRISAEGYLGIGTTSPAANLEIFGTGNTLRLDSAANESKTILLRNVGTATAEIKTDGNLDFNIEDAGRTMRFLNGNTERMRIDSSGRVGIGTSSPQQALHTQSTGSSTIIAERTGANAAIVGLYASQNPAIVWGTSSDSLRFAQVDDNNLNGFTERMRIDSSGNTTFTGTLSVSAGQEIRIAGSSDANHYLKKIGTGYSGVTIDGPQLQGHQGGELTTNYLGDAWALRWSIGGNVSVNNNFFIGGYTDITSTVYTRSNLEVLNAAGTGWNQWATRSNGQYNLNIGGLTVNGTGLFTGALTLRGQTNDYDGNDRSSYWAYDDKVALALEPAADDGAVAIFFKSIGNAPSDFAYIVYDEDYGEAGVAAGENGALILGCENDGQGSSDHVRVKSRLVVEGDMSSSDPTKIFQVKSSNTTSDLFYVNNSGNYDFAGSDLSDRTLKENIVDINEGLDVIIQLKPKKYNFITNPEITKGGFIAQEVEEVLPDAINGEEGNKGLDYKSILAHAVKAIQEQQTQIEELKAEIQLLKNQ